MFILLVDHISASKISFIEEHDIMLILTNGGFATIFNLLILASSQLAP